MAYGGLLSGSVAAGPVQASASVGGVPSMRPGDVPPPVYKMLLVLVGIEVFLLMGGRLAFKHHHGG